MDSSPTIRNLESYVELWVLNYPNLGDLVWEYNFDGKELLSSLAWETLDAIGLWDRESGELLPLGGRFFLPDKIRSLYAWLWSWHNERTAAHLVIISLLLRGIYLNGQQLRAVMDGRHPNFEISKKALDWWLKKPLFDPEVRLALLGGVPKVLGCQEFLDNVKLEDISASRYRVSFTGLLWGELGCIDRDTHTITIGSHVFKIRSNMTPQELAEEIRQQIPDATVSVCSSTVTILSEAAGVDMAIKVASEV